MKNIITLFLTLTFFNGFAQTDYFWIGGNGNWSDITHWSTTSGGTDMHTQIPTSLDNVYFDANSFDSTGQAITLDSENLVCNNIDFTGVTNSPNFNGNSKTLLLYGSINLVSEMTVSTPNINFEATTTGQTLTTAGHALGGLFFNGIGGAWTLQDPLTASSIDLNYGTLNTNSHTVNVNSFNSNHFNVRALTLGSSFFNIVGNGNWNVRATTNFTLAAGTSTINLTDGQFLQGEDNTSNGWDLTYYNVNFSPTGDNKG